jgi:hypothetical protein
MNSLTLKEARRLIVKLTAFDESLDELINRWTMHGYRPTLLAREGTEQRRLADYYDIRAEERGIDVKAYRGN